LDVIMSPAPKALRDNPYLVQLFGEDGWGDVRIRAFSLKALFLRRPDVLHIHFPHHLVDWEKPLGAPFDVVTVLASLWLARRRGVAVVWTGHDLAPHELRRPRLWRLYNRSFLSQVDLLISLSDGATRLLRQRYPQLARVPVAVIPHGHYRQHYTAPADPDLFRRRMGLDRRPVLLCFGLLRPYKNIPGVIRAWRELPGPRPQLVVAGRPIDSALEAEVREAAEGAEDAHLLLDYAADQEVPSIFAAADVVVMPYTPGSALNSGAAHLALSMGRPVVVNDTPVNRDLRDFFGPEWVWLCGESPEAALRTAAAAAAASRPALPELGMLDPGRLAALTRNAYATAVERRRGQPAWKARRGHQPDRTPAGIDQPDVS
jgi:glycosyltransferase involved in cell wall biosynthesis